MYYNRKCMPTIRLEMRLPHFILTMCFLCPFFSWLVSLASMNAAILYLKILQLWLQTWALQLPIFALLELSASHGDKTPQSLSFWKHQVLFWALGRTKAIISFKAESCTFSHYWLHQLLRVMHDQRRCSKLKISIPGGGVCLHCNASPAPMS